MASVIIGSVGEFNELSDTWNNYIQRLQQFFIANDIQDETKKKAVLISSVGPKTYKLLSSLALSNCQGS